MVTPMRISASGSCVTAPADVRLDERPARAHDLAIDEHVRPVVAGLVPAALVERDELGAVGGELLQQAGEQMLEGVRAAAPRSACA